MVEVDMDIVEDESLENFQPSAIGGSIDGRRFYVNRCAG